VRSDAFFAPEEATVLDVSFPAGSRLFLDLAVAHRDPEAFDEPDRLDLRRVRPRPHLNFGSGRHHCLGAALARMEIESQVDGALTAWSTMTPVTASVIRRDDSATVEQVRVRAR
jgi:cytochrome P450